MKNSQKLDKVINLSLPLHSLFKTWCMCVNLACKDKIDSMRHMFWNQQYGDKRFGPPQIVDFYVNSPSWNRNVGTRNFVWRQLFIRTLHSEKFSLLPQLLFRLGGDKHAPISSYFADVWKPFLPPSHFNKRHSRHLILHPAIQNYS